MLEQNKSLEYLNLNIILELPEFEAVSVFRGLRKNKTLRRLIINIAEEEKEEAAACLSENYVLEYVSAPLSYLNRPENRIVRLSNFINSKFCGKKSTVATHCVKTQNTAYARTCSSTYPL